MTNSGIYTIKNTKNKKKYIGQSVNIKKRIHQHKAELRSGTHINKHLQSSFNKYGEKNFKFTTLKKCPPEELDQYEIKYIKKYDTTNPKKGYNHEEGGKKNKKVSLHSKLKRRTGKRGFTLNSKTTPAYMFRNWCFELWNTVRNYERDADELKDIHLILEDINEGYPPEEYIVTESYEEDGMTNYKKLLNKYYRTDGKNLAGYEYINKSERLSNEFNKKIKRNSRRKHRHLILDELVAESPFHITKTQIREIRNWIDIFNDDFKNFHRNSSNETIILAFIFIQQKHVNPKIDPDKYSICDKYNLSTKKFALIQNRLIFKLMGTIQLTYQLEKYVNQNFQQNNEE